MRLAELRESYPAAREAVEDLAKAQPRENRQVLVLRGQRDGAIKQVFYNPLQGPDAKGVDEEFKSLWHQLKVPDLVDLPKELEQGMSQFPPSLSLSLTHAPHKPQQRASPPRTCSTPPYPPMLSLPKRKKAKRAPAHDDSSCKIPTSKVSISAPTLSNPANLSGYPLFPHCTALYLYPIQRISSHPSPCTRGHLHKKRFPSSSKRRVVVVVVIVVYSSSACWGWSVTFKRGRGRPGGRCRPRPRSRPQPWPRGSRQSQRHAVPQRGRSGQPRRRTPRACMPRWR